MRFSTARNCLLFYSLHLQHPCWPQSRDPAAPQRPRAPTASARHRCPQAAASCWTLGCPVHGRIPCLRSRSLAASPQGGCARPQVYTRGDEEEVLAELPLLASTVGTEASGTPPPELARPPVAPAGAPDARMPVVRVPRRAVAAASPQTIGAALSMKARACRRHPLVSVQSPADHGVPERMYGRIAVEASFRSCACVPGLEAFALAASSACAVALRAHGGLHVLIRCVKGKRAWPALPATSPGRYELCLGAAQSTMNISSFSYTGAQSLTAHMQARGAPAAAQPGSHMA